FTKLMRYVMMTNANPELLTDISSMIKNNPKLLNEKNHAGWTALMLACRNSNTQSSVQTVKLLINAKADLNLKTNKEWTALMMAFDNLETSHLEKTIELLIDVKINHNSNIEHECSRCTKSTGFTKLMRYVMMTNEFPGLLNVIKMM